MKKLSLLPDGLPFRLDLIEWIRFAALAHVTKPGMNRNKHRILRASLMQKIFPLFVRIRVD